MTVSMPIPMTLDQKAYTQAIVDALLAVNLIRPQIDWRDVGVSFHLEDSGWAAALYWKDGILQFLGEGSPACLNVVITCEGQYYSYDYAYGDIPQEIQDKLGFDPSKLKPQYVARLIIRALT